MNLKHLGAFLKVLEMGSVTRAAAAMHIAQSALSRQIQQLEEELAVTLLTRLDRGVVPTEAGLLLRDRGVALLEQARDLKESLAGRAAEPLGELSVGFPPSLYDLVSLPLLQAYRSRYPKVQLRITEGISAEMLERVVTGRLDAVVISRGELLDGLECVPVASEPMVLVGPASAQRQLGTQVDLATLARLPLIVTPRPNALRQAMDQAMQASQLPVPVVMEVNTSRMAIDLAAAGVGWSVLPSSATLQPRSQGKVAVAPIDGMRVSWGLVYSRARALSRATQALRLAVLDRVGRLLEDGAWPDARRDD